MAIKRVHSFAIFSVLLLLLQSCTTATKSTIYSASAGAVICGLTGYAIAKDTSPNKESESINQLIGVLAGAILCGSVGGYLGYKFYKDDPENFVGDPLELNSMKLKRVRPVKLNRKIKLENLGTDFGQ